MIVGFFVLTKWIAPSGENLHPWFSLKVDAGLVVRRDVIKRDVIKQNVTASSVLISLLPSRMETIYVLCNL